MNAIYAVLIVWLVIGLDSWFAHVSRIAWDPLRAALVTFCMPARLICFVLGYLMHCVVTWKLPRRLFAADFWLLPCAIYWAAWDGCFVGMPIKAPE